MSEYAGWPNESLIAQYKYHRNASVNWDKKAEEFLFNHGMAAIRYAGYKELEEEANFHNRAAKECYDELFQRGVSPF